MFLNLTYFFNSKYLPIQQTKKLNIVATAAPYPSYKGINIILRITFTNAPKIAVKEIIVVLLIAVSILWHVPEIADIKNAIKSGGTNFHAI